MHLKSAASSRALKGWWFLFCFVGSFEKRKERRSGARGRPRKRERKKGKGRKEKSKKRISPHRVFEAGGGHGDLNAAPRIGGAYLRGWKKTKKKKEVEGWESHQIDLRLTKNEFVCAFPHSIDRSHRRASSAKKPASVSSRQAAARTFSSSVGDTKFDTSSFWKKAENDEE